MACSTTVSSFSGTSQSLAISSELTEKILMTHAYTTREVDLQPLVKVIEGILQNAASKCAYVVSTDMISSLENYDGMRQVLDDIRSISCEMSCSLTSIDAITMEVLRRLSNYSWNSKMVLAITAFTVRVGELLMLANHRHCDPVANSVDLIKGVAPRIDLTLLNDLLRAMQDVVKTNMAFLVPPISTIPKYSASMKDAVEYFPTAAYKIVRIIVQIASILSKREDNLDLRIRCLTGEVYDVNFFLQEKLALCKKVIEQEMHSKTCTTYTIEQVGTIIPCEAVWELIPTISYWEIIQKIKYSLKIQVHEKLRNKHVLFLVSDLDISVEEIKTLNQLYLKSNQKYEIVWLPVLDIASYNRRKLSELQTLMKWCSVDPCKMGTVMVEFIKKEWHFVKNPIVVALNPDGSVACSNALPMLWTWGNAAFPFDSLKEKELWSTYDETNGWRLDLFINEHIDLDIQSWIHGGAFVCLFGGENMSWIQDFTEKVKMAMNCTGIPLKLVYVGTNKGKGLQRNHLGLGLGLGIHVIQSESQWHFWTRLESILYAKIQQGKTTKTDIVMQESSRILGYAAKGEAWATFAMGTAAMVTANREMATNIVAKYRAWRQNTTYVGTGFLEAIRSYYSIIKADHDVHVGRCCSTDVQLPAMQGEVPGIVSCPGCFKDMKVFYTYRCCNE